MGKFFSVQNIYIKRRLENLTTKYSQLKFAQLKSKSNIKSIENLILLLFFLDFLFQILISFEMFQILSIQSVNFWYSTKSDLNKEKL